MENAKGLVLYIDGGCSGNDSKDIYRRRMVAVVTDKHGNVLSEQEESGGSNNIAELIAVRDAIQIALAAEASALHVLTDSRNSLAWTFGTRVGKKINDRPRVLALKAEITETRARLVFSMSWVPREENIAGHYIEKRYSL